jgi:hypothetical protein
MSNGNGASRDNGHSGSPPPDYEEKFADFIAMCEDAEADDIDIVVVAEPQTLGDTYEEIIESLSRLADAGLALRIVGR